MRDSDADWRSRLERLPRWFDLLWLALLALYILAGAPGVPFHGDESTLIAMGRDYHTLFIEGDLREILYDEGRRERREYQHLRLMNGTVSKTIYGWLAWQNGIDGADLNRGWHWLRDYDINLETGRIPDAGLLEAARLASALQLAVAVALFFQFTRATLNRPTAFIASAIFALHPNVLINGRRAMMEGSHLLGLMLLLLAATWLLRERRWRAYLLFGVCMGFAVAAKHPNVIVCLTAFVAVAWVMLTRRQADSGAERQSISRVLLRLLAAGLIAVLVFLLLNPAWWSTPAELPAVIVIMRQELLANQVELFGGYADFADQVGGFFRFVFGGAHQYFEVAHWAEYDVITAQIHAYERSGLAGLLIGSASATAVVSLLLSIFGAIRLARDGAVAVENRRLLFCWMGGSALLTLLLTPLPWARYYLPLAPALALLVAYGLVGLAGVFWHGIQLKANGVALLA